MRMSWRTGASSRQRSIAAVPLVAVLLALALSGTHPASSQSAPDGQLIFRFDTFGDEQLWTDTLKLHQVIEASVTPRIALAVGLKVDGDALPPNFLAAANLDDPATTLELLRLNAVVGVVGTVKGNNLKSVGITCALCHSTVDDSVAPGIGRRLDGWPNRQLDPGAIIALSPAITAQQRAVYRSWGPGKFDPRFNVDGINLPVMIPPAYGVPAFETYTGDGPISYWNNYVAVVEMGGHGSFSDPRIGISITQTPDLVTPKLPALRGYQSSLPIPSPPRGSFETRAARRGEVLFNGRAQCARCHMPPDYTDVSIGTNPNEPFLHDPSEIPTEPVYASRSATKRYRTTPLRAVWARAPYFHDGSASDLFAVIDVYNKALGLNLSARQREDLVQFLKSL